MPNTISKEPIGSKLNPIILSSESDIIKYHLHRGVYYQCNCNRCGRTFIRSYRNNKRVFLCTTCQKSETTLKHYGVDNPAKSKEIMDKIKNTNLDRYGNTCSAQGEEIKKKIEKISMERYGVENPLLATSTRNHNKQVMLEKYNVSSPFALPEVQQKSKETRLKKYGASMGYNKSPYNYNNMIFDSSWELAFYIYAIDHNYNIIREPIELPYIVNNKEYHYFPDFLVNGTLYEIKSQYWIDKQYASFGGKEKFECIKNNNVIIISNKEIIKYLDYISNTYSKNYLTQFKLKHN